MHKIYQTITSWRKQINPVLLLFLILVLNVKMPVKILAITGMLIYKRKKLADKYLFTKNYTWFYLSMIILAGLNLLLNISSAQSNYIIVVLVAAGFWGMCLASALLLFIFIRESDEEKLHKTVTAYFLINVIVTVSQLFVIILDGGSLNPYLYQGMQQKYFINTGDWLTGASFDVSTTNALLNAFGFLYFFYRNKTGLSLLCMFVMLLTTSNFTNILMLALLLLMFIFRSSRVQKSIIVVCLAMLAVFQLKISPQNFKYLTEAGRKINGKQKQKSVPVLSGVNVTEQPDSLLSDEDKKRKVALLYLDSLTKTGQHISAIPAAPINPPVKPSIPKADIHSKPYQKRMDTTILQKKLLDFAVVQIAAFDTTTAPVKTRRLPGKLIAFKQTLTFLKDHPVRLVTGAGAGNFSSKLAFRVSALQIAGSYPEQLAYINDDFLNNHLNLYLNYFSKERELHSLIHTPNSVYDQLLAEYGVAGLAIFILFYLSFFLRKHYRRSYGLPLLFILCAAFGVEYWFEQLSIVIVFELLMLILAKENNQLA